MGVDALVKKLSKKGLVDYYFLENLRQQENKIYKDSHLKFKSGNLYIQRQRWGWTMPSSLLYLLLI